MDIELPTCPVCHQLMTKTGINNKMYHCPRRQAWFEDLGLSLTVIDTTIVFDNVGNKVIEIIDVPPYTFTLKNTPDGGQNTEVQKTIIENQSGRGLRVAGKVKLFEVPSLINLQWSNRDKVIDRVKLYLIFS